MGSRTCRPHPSPVLPVAALPCEPPSYPTNRRPILQTAAVSCQLPPYPADRRPILLGIKLKLTRKESEGVLASKSGRQATECRLFAHTLGGGRVLRAPKIPGDT